MGNPIEKRTIAQFVHDAVEMETAIFTLDKLEQDIKTKKQDLLTNAEKEIQKATQYVNQYKIEYNNTKQEFEKIKSKKYYDNDFPWGRFVLFSFLFFIALLPILPFVVALIGHAGGKIAFISLNVAVIIWIGSAIIIAIIISYIFTYKTNQKDNEAARSAHQAQLTEAENAYNRATYNYQGNLSRLRSANENYDIAQKKEAMYEEQLLSLNDTRAKIKGNLRSFYNYNLIPLDYRYLDCVVMLDQIFRNDLADTMREAIKIYEERVFRGSVIRGMDKICSMLGKLSSDMSEISLKLDMINNNVAHMSGDLERFNQRIAAESAKNRAATEELIKETQLGRYTNEKLLESNKRLEYYAEEYRMGRMPIR